MTDNWGATLKRTTVVCALETVPLADWSEVRRYPMCHLKNVGTRMHKHILGFVFGLLLGLLISVTFGLGLLIKLVFEFRSYIVHD